MSLPESKRGFWRGFLLGLATLVVMTVVFQVVNQPPPAYGQVPDSGAQRLRMIKEMSTTNQKLTEIVGLLKEIRDQGVAEKKEKEHS